MPKPSFRCAIALIGLLLVAEEPSASAQGTPDPFLSVPAPAAAPRPVEPPAPRAAQPRAAAGGFPVGVGQSFRDCAECPEMVVLAAGRFVMGTQPTERERGPTEPVATAVQVPASFAIGRFEVTVEEWEACLRGGGCGGYRPPEFSRPTPRHPVDFLSYNDVQGYIRWINARTGRRYRLPTDAEREYAARAGTTAPWPTVSPPTAADAKFLGPSPVTECARHLRQGGIGTCPVGSYRPNAFGLYDMMGNVDELVEGCPGPLRIPVNASALPRELANCPGRIVRGGSWRNLADFARSAAREPVPFDYRFSGFRLVRLPQ